MHSREIVLPEAWGTSDGRDIRRDPPDTIHSALALGIGALYQGMNATAVRGVTR